MAIPIHVVYVRLQPVSVATGQVRDKNSAGTTLEAITSTRHEHRVQPSRPGKDAPVPNASDQPDVPTFLAREAADGYALVFQNQRMIVTYG